MSRVIKIFPRGSEDYSKLESFAEKLTRLSGKGYTYYVGVTYFDYGQGWKWTTVLGDGSKWGSFQAISPAIQELVLNGQTAAAIKRFFQDKFCPDTIRKRQPQA